MKAIVQTGPEAVEVQERDRPEIGPDEVLVRVHSAGLCGSDAHAYKYEGGYEWIPFPRIMGHEYAGEVVEVGSAVEDLSVGETVIEHPVHTCGQCFQCRNGQANVCQEFSITGMHRDGAWAEYTAVDADFLHRVPDGVSPAEAAITEPTSIATRAVIERSATAPGDTVLVEGPGPIGVLTAAVADAHGASVLVSGLERDAAHRLPLVADLGIETIDASMADLDAVADDFTDGIGFDVVFDTTGHRSGVETAADQIRKGGQIVAVGLPGEPSELFMTDLVRAEVELTTSYASLWPDFERALRLMESGDIRADSFVDRSFDIDHPDAAFEAMLAAETCKPVFTFDDG